MNYNIYFNCAVDSVLFTQCVAKRFKGIVNIENATFMPSRCSFYNCVCHYKNYTIEFKFYDIDEFKSDGVNVKYNDINNLQVSYDKGYHSTNALIELINDKDDDYNISTETKNNRNVKMLNMLIKSLELYDLFEDNVKPSKSLLSQIQLLHQL